MALADKYFKDQMRVIRENGFKDKDFKVRAKWEVDNVPAHTSSLYFHSIHNTFESCRPPPVLPDIV